MKFLVIGDFHYKKNMYVSTVADLDTMLRRACENHVDFVVHTGDFCNDYSGSPELLDTYLNNQYHLPVFGIYGNHELETRGNTMDFVTPRLCNRDVHFGSDDAGYWYYDTKGFRMIGLDTNYSFNESLDQWQHNLPASWGEPAGNKFAHSISPLQLQWLDRTLAEASEKGLKVIVFSHSALSGQWYSSPDADYARSLFDQYKGTVLMNINGHLHTDHFCVLDNIAYFDVNTVINGAWYGAGEFHYDDAHTYIREVVQCDGKIIGTETGKLNDLTQGKNTWFFEEPLSAIVDISLDGTISITGAKTSWRYGIVPPWHNDGMMPEIPDRTAKLI